MPAPCGSPPHHHAMLFQDPLSMASPAYTRLAMTQSPPPAQDGHVTGCIEQQQLPAARQPHCEQRRRAFQRERVARAAAVAAARNQLQGMAHVEGAVRRPRGGRSAGRALVCPASMVVSAFNLLPLECLH